VKDTTQVGNLATAHACAGERSAEEAGRALLAFISAGDRSAMDKLYALYFARLANFFLHLTTNADLVEELIDDTMVEVWQKSASIGANASVAVTIMRLAYSRGQKCFAETRATRPHVQRGIQDTDHDITLPTTLDRPSSLQDFLLKLPVEERAVLHLVYTGGHSRRDIADIMKISCECVDVLLGDARLRLRHGYAQGYVVGDSSYLTVASMESQI
jgi:RNA polymerase sigma-70 factor, ECF subfamily